MPATAADAKGLLLSSIFDDNPVVFLEHRWLHNLEGEVPENDFRIPIGKAERLKTGEDISIVSFSYMTVEALHAVEFLETNGISAELINLRSIKPIDWEMIFSSVRKTGRLLALDTGPESGSIAGEVIARVSSNCFDALKQAPRRLTLPDIPTPTSLALTKVFYKRAEDIADVAGSMLGKDLDTSALQIQRKFLHDVPGDWFKGPF